MSAGELPWQGGCRCGEVRIKVSGQRFSRCMPLYRLPANDRERVLAERRHSERRLRGHTRRACHAAFMRSATNFCPHCMSWMFTRPEGMDWFVNLRATMPRRSQLVQAFIET